MTSPSEPAPRSQHFELASLMELYDRPENRKSVLHNFALLKCIRGGLRMAEAHRVTLDPRDDYWRLPERRLTIAYFAERWHGRFVRPRQTRSAALRILHHMDHARVEGIISHVGIQYEEAGGIESLCLALAGHARGLSANGDWNDLRAAWPKLAVTPGEDLARFLEHVPGRASWDHGFFRRLPWFGYLAAVDEEDVARRQAFFYGFANLWTTTNAYVHGGALALAPVLQNTRSERLIDYPLEWASGVTPLSTGFRTVGRDDPDGDPQDRAQYSSVIEVYGFLNLERVPFYNKLAETYREWFRLDAPDDPYQLTARVGELTRQWVDEHPAAAERLVSLRQIADGEPWNSRVEFEGISSAAATAQAHAAELVDSRLFDQLRQHAAAEMQRLAPAETASLMLHLLLDSRLYNERIESLPIQVTPPLVQAPEVRSEPPSISKSLSADRDMVLPPALRDYGTEALAYLKAGLHVLFAGAPGTGKTTLAQFVGHAWNNQLDALTERIPRAAAPVTTVGNSAWSPFHTIGGMVPSENDTFDLHRGIFIDTASSDTGRWRLYDGAIVLDEMNRADLDRCIGELYPLLSDSVASVSPAGLRGIDAIDGNPRFRVIATVNDATIDDIVFPISEGLARRFQRVELPGASLSDILDYAEIDRSGGSREERQEAAHEALSNLMRLAESDGLLQESDEGARFPFGVAYFALLRAWLARKLESAGVEGSPRDQARHWTAAALRTLRREKKWEAIAVRLAP